MAGSEIGSLAAPETLGASVAAGAFFGGVFGAASGLYNQLTGHKDAKTYTYDGQTFEYTDENDFNRKIKPLSVIHDQKMKAEKVAKRVKELTENEERERLYARGNVKQLRSRLKDLGIKGFSNKNKALLVERLQLYGDAWFLTHTHLFYW